MSIIALILLVALLIPIMGIVVDSPIGRALARRLEGPQAAPPGLAELAGRLLSSIRPPIRSERS